MPGLPRFPSLLLPVIEMSTGTGGEGGMKWPQAKGNLDEEITSIRGRSEMLCTESFAIKANENVGKASGNICVFSENVKMLYKLMTSVSASHIKWTGKVNHL